jgi:hypothetical protein
MPGSGKLLKQPIYPRPVSPLQYEPLYTRPEDVLWEQDSAEERSDHDEGIRAAKRRRIEKAGEAYLRGEPLFILSASIRGPLGEGWVNPWSKYKWRGRVLGSDNLPVQGKVEVPETVERGGRGGTPAKHEKDKAILQKENPTRSAKQVENSRRSRIHHDPFFANTTSLDNRKTSEVCHGQTWLKKDSNALTGNGNFYTEDNHQQRGDSSSPIRQPGPARRKIPLQAERGQRFNNETSDAGSFGGRAETLIQILRRRGNAVKLPMIARRQEVAPAQKPPSASQEDDSCSANQAQSPPDSIPPDAAEAHTARQILSPAAEIAEQRLPSPPSEASPVGQDRLQIEPLPVMETSTSFALTTDPPESLVSAAKDCPINQQPVDLRQQSEKLDPSELTNAKPSVPPPTLSTATSSATVVGIMPSAQVALTVQAPLNDSLPCTGDKLSEQQDQSQEEGDRAFSLSTQAAIAATHIQLQNDIITPAAPMAASSTDVNMKPMTHPKSKSGITLFSAFNKRQPNSIFTTTHDSPNTQEMLNAVTPFDLATTVKRVPLTTIRPNSDSPTIAAQKAVKNRATKNKKKASFAPPPTDSTLLSTSGSSQGSIKRSLRVSKNGTWAAAIGVSGKPDQGIINSMAGKATTDASFPAFGNPSLDMKTSFEGDIDSFAYAVTADQDMTDPAPSKPATNTTTTHSSKSTSTKQDAQMLPPSTFLYHRVSTDESSAKQLPYHHQGGIAGGGGEWGWDFGSGSTPNGENNSTNHDGHDDKDGQREVDADVYPGGRGDGAGNENEFQSAPPPPPAFDLSAAMDEVGSFLLSWDTDKEIREMERERVVEKVAETRTAGEKVEGRDGDVEVVPNLEADADADADAEKERRREVRGER